MAFIKYTVNINLFLMEVVMSFISRITRALDSFNQISNDETTKFGMAGEQEAKRFIEEESGLILYNPIIPLKRDIFILMKYLT